MVGDSSSKIIEKSEFATIPSWHEIKMSRILQASWIAKDNTLYASAFNHLYKSSDGGVTFQDLKAFNCKGLDSIYVDKENNIFVSPGVEAGLIDAGLWRSTDKGLTWTKVLALPLSSSVWAIDEDTDRKLFAGIYTRGPFRNARIYRSTDSGGTWTMAYFDSKARHIHDVTVDKSNNNIYATLGDKYVPESNRAYILRSEDGGKSWKKILKNLPQMVAVEAIPGARLFGTDDVENGELYKTMDDNKSVRVLDTGTPGCCFWIRREPNSGRIVASFVSGEAPKKAAALYVSDDNGQNWTLYRTFKTNLSYEGSSRSSNFQKGTLYYSVRLEGTQRNGVKLLTCFG